MISLLDSVDAHLIDVWLVFYDHPPERRLSWLWKLLEPEFSHVEAWREDRGAWCRLDSCLEFLNAEVHLQPPWEVIPQARFVHVIRLVPLGKVREPLMFGPITCVELSKAAIGLRAPLVRTPYALYKYARNRKWDSSPVWLSLRLSLSRFRRHLRGFVARLTSFGAPDEITEKAEGVPGSGGAPRTPSPATLGTGRAGEPQDQADDERRPRLADVPQCAVDPRVAVEHVGSADVRTAR